MAINRNQFFDVVREEVTGGKLNQGQVDGCKAILDYWEKAWAKSDDRWLAYMLGTAYHESAHTMQPVRETLEEVFLKHVEGKRRDQPGGGA